MLVNFQNGYLIQITGKLLSIFGTTWICGSPFSGVNFRISKYRSSISEEILVSKLRCAISVKYILNLKT